MKDTFELTKDESDLFHTLESVVKDMNLNTTLRVAGGWVRDKILYSKAKADVDIVLDNMTGAQFCECYNEWAKQQGQRQYHVAVIQQNPDKSKHLETATMKLGSLFVDFVNLRSESYAADSRIPMMAFGTPLEDAERRDLTINSLFYNIHSGGVEDHTGMGLSDIQAMLIRTPLEPFTTLKDDPLRVLRVVRFACRLGFRIEPQLLQACGDASVHHAMMLKVSRERMIAEIEGTIGGQCPAAPRGLYLYHRLKLLPIILVVPPKVMQSNVGNSCFTFTPGCTEEHIALRLHSEGSVHALIGEFIEYLLAPKIETNYSPPLLQSITDSSAVTDIGTFIRTAVASRQRPRLSAVFAELVGDTPSIEPYSTRRWLFRYVLLIDVGVCSYY
jgi:tRNA nucleotidyltransferase/poly(A) polymerase